MSDCPHCGIHPGRYSFKNACCLARFASVNYGSDESATAAFLDREQKALRLGDEVIAEAKQRYLILRGM